ncbi:MAG: type I restriction-modification enzyme R subunit C-terminal domain-containing protein, partial [Cyanobium sp.]
MVRGFPPSGSQGGFAVAALIQRQLQRPEDYLEGFSAFVRDPGNDLPALTLVLTRPWELSRKDLRELRLALDQRGYSETTLATAWRETTNQEMAAS